MRLSSESIERLILPQLESVQVKLCTVKVSGPPFNPLIQVFIDREEGHISIDDCTGLTRSVQNSLDLEDSTPPNYRLEVSSPGTDWPLTELWQFRKNIGRTIRLKRPIALPNSQGKADRRVSEVRIIAVTENEKIRLGLLEHPSEADNFERTVQELAGACVIFEILNKKSKRK
ncbi:MAG: hypothetical protein P9M15_01150 [Candidatus Electryoneaceae bacterium]|nr:hypothetical protein [Candidatus Electryoneaceae bacterium]